MSLDLKNKKIGKSDYSNYVNTQLNHFFPDGFDNKVDLNKNIDEALDRINFSTKHVKLKGYTNVSFLHSVSYMLSSFIFYQILFGIIVKI